MALVRASTNAKSVAPQQIAKALAQLKISEDQSVDGIHRDFTEPYYQHCSLVQIVPVEGRLVWAKYIRD